MHTPGPWKFHAMTNEISIYTASNADKVARVPLFKITDNSRREADARLIAAAPDLLEALKAVVAAADQDDDWQPWAQQARAALAKVENA